MKAVFVKSAAKYSQCIVSDLPQIAVVGKSNVGKSTFINTITGRKNLAKTSKEPGRTRLINYFLIDDKYFLTDLPGYGYAKVSMAEKQSWAELIETYLQKEEKLAHVFFLVDIRHEPTSDDMLMYDYLFKNTIPFTIIATKADKLSNSQAANARQKLATIFKVGRDNIITTSSISKKGIEEVIGKINLILNTETEKKNEED